MRKPQRTLTTLLVVGALLAACDGSTKKSSGSSSGAELRLSSVDYGRLVDIYAYRRVNAANGQRRDVGNRSPVLVARDVVIDPRVESQPLFDPLGEEDPNADFQFQPFSVSTGHEELVILWDDQNPDEKPRFDAALTRAQTGLVQIAAAYTGQNTAVQPIPVVPRNAALRLKFTQTVSVDSSFFVANPSALQVLEIVDDPLTVQPQRAFRALPYRVVVAANTLVLDPSLIGGEVQAGGKTTPGLPLSRDSVGANIRLAIPTQSPGGNLGLKEDQVAQLNGRDRTGLPSVIRDFRTGNASDGRIGNLIDVDRPMIVADVPMGITAIDTVNKVLTINKRGAQVAVRGLVPFVVGPLSVTPPELPLGPAEVPTVTPLRSGDIITQLVTTPAGVARVRAVVVMNLDVSNSGTLVTNPSLGRAADGSDGGGADTVRVKVASLSVTDATGNTASFQASNSPSGADCTMRVHYYENIPYGSGSFAVSDATRREEFVAFDPATPRIDPVTRQPIPLGTRISPLASLSIRFSEPLDFETVESTGNIFVGNRHFTDTAAIPMLTEPKAAALSMLASKAEDFQLDGTVVRVNLPLGHTHDTGQEEQYWLHVLANDAAAKDLAGNPVEIYDRRLTNDVRKAFSVDYTMEPAAAPNLVGVRVMRFEATDEDGTKPGSPDYFGQFELSGGRIWGAAVQRFNKVADSVNIAGIIRGPNGECFTPGNPMSAPPIPGAHILWGPLYTTPSMVQTTAPLPPPNPFQPPATPYIYGGIAGPHNPRGMREQVTFREDDFQLGFHDPGTMMIDVEQLYWSPFLNRTVLFDQFDRYTLRLGHANRRPDLKVKMFQVGMAQVCGLDCASLFSGLSTRFDDNPLNGVMVEVVKDRVYTIEPAESFRATTNNVYAPYPKFARTFTWRDSRQVSWDPTSQTATGLGGAADPSAQNIPPQDTTHSVSSPWEQDVFPTSNFPPPAGPLPTASGYVVTDPGDFIGDRQRDHDPIALPLLLEFNLWPDDRTINGRANATNRMHIGYVGYNAHQSPFWGYFNLGTVAPAPIWGRAHGNSPRPNCNGLAWPSFTVHSGGSVNAVGLETLIDPSLERVARGSVILDAGSTDITTGLTPVPAANDHLYWTQANFVRRVSMVTFGFFDTLRPNRHALVASDLEIQWPGLTDTAGLPDFQSAPTRRAVDVVTLFDPPIERQPSGTSMLFELRGIESITNAGALWDRGTENRAIQRQNLANPEYACEAFRHAMANPGPESSTPRVVADGITPYVDIENLDRLRSATSGLLPRYLNFRLVFENDINVALPKRPSLRSMAVVYRVRTP